MTDATRGWRLAWLMLALVSLANYGNFYVYDSIGRSPTCCSGCAVSAIRRSAC